MILLDASLIIDALRSHDPTLVTSTIAVGAVCGITRAEVLSGVRTSSDEQRITTLLNRYQQVNIPADSWDDAGLFRARLGSQGLSVPLPDATVALLAIRLDVELWQRDKHFPAIQKLVSNLRLYVEPSP